MYHFVCVAKYRRLVISTKIDQVLREVCKEIFQSIPSYIPTKIIKEKCYSL